ncbi:hypothetical protein BD626DRAFT_576071 [Schizophyllum amplum]|uniref:NmrA-like domain-containing protein n=1 Tax=Schizophyllum amplum TaxID=97359 RepID=A0A550BUC1_9AGAR|nr:hypothetical protein BD626DRAFT_576071 [Auriculariopsis ampla]
MANDDDLHIFMANNLNIFMTGATGYIGGAVLARLLRGQNSQKLHIKALVRDAGKALKLKDFGVEPVMGTLDDAELIEKEASKADVIISAASADHEPSCQAILRGAKTSFRRTAMQPIFIHTSGIMSLADNARGMHGTDTIYDDADANAIAALPVTQLHRNVDTKIVAADAAGYVYAYLVLPSLIYGQASHALARAGITNTRSIALPILSKAALARGRPGVIGRGANVVPCVELEEQADMYIVLMNAALRGAPFTRHGREGHYFGASDECTLEQVSRGIGQAMVKLGCATDPNPTPFTMEEIDEYLWGSEVMGANARCQATQAKALGWKPTKTTKDMLESIEKEVQDCIRA